mgnify:CR=1 FL=1
MLDQYRRIKARYRDVILFFRLGDFYEMFYEDAIEASALLDLTLTKRQEQPMCGIPYHAAKPYIARLLKAGKKVAICEQLSAPGSKGIIERDVIEVVTPGTSLEEDFLDHSSNNYIASVCILQKACCIAYLDVSTGEFLAYRNDNPHEETSQFLRSEFYRLNPREIIIQQSMYENPPIFSLLREFEGMLVEKRPDWSFDIEKASQYLKDRFKVASLKGFGFDDQAPELAAAGAVLEYIEENSKTRCPHIRSILPYQKDDYLVVDEATKKNLEIVRNLQDSGKRDTLLFVLDRTKTAGGSRLLKQWLLQPLRQKHRIEERLDAVEHLYHDQLLLNEARRRLSAILDTERLTARLAMNKAHAKDLLALSDSVHASLELTTFMSQAFSKNQEKIPKLLEIHLSPEEVEDCRKLFDSIKTAIKEEPSILLTEGNLIKSGWNETLDHLRNLKKNSTAVLESYLEQERAKTGIQNLRIRYNKIIGYYLEVTKGKLDSVPPHFIRRQSLVGSERYTTDMLADLESEINGATEKIIELEKSLFLEIRENLKQYIPSIEQLARQISEIDCLVSFAQAATEGGYCRPELLEAPILDIRQGRHPVVETCIPQASFVPNSIALSTQATYFALITGPNMAGKSTVLRQTALITLMAHLGSFVPAEEARIGLTDKIFCRVGAQDNLARGESTFLVEMHETAYILNTATENSLVIMDEVGRGTGTLDGVSIAWAVSMYLLERIKCRTLFATHYHELTSMEHPGLINMSMAVLENEGEIVFLKRLKEGASAGSYGLHVASLAGIPAAVLENARALQEKLSRFEHSLSLTDTVFKRAEEKQAELSASPKAKAGELFSAEDLALARLRGIDPDSLTPLQALMILHELKSML